MFSFMCKHHMLYTESNELQMQVRLIGFQLGQLKHITSIPQLCLLHNFVTVKKKTHYPEFCF